MVLFLSNDILMLLLLSLGRLALLRPLLHLANIRHGRLRAIRRFGFACLRLSHSLFSSFSERVWRIFLGWFSRFRLRKDRLHGHAHTSFQQQRFLMLRGSKTRLPVLAFVQAGQPGSEDNLGGEGRFDKADEDRAVAYL